MSISLPSANNQTDKPPAHIVILTSQDLEGSSEEEASSLLKREKLAEKQEQRQDAEDDGQDHEGLDRLNPNCNTDKKASQHISSFTCSRNHLKKLVVLEAEELLSLNGLMLHV